LLPVVVEAGQLVDQRAIRLLARLGELLHCGAPLRLGLGVAGAPKLAEDGVENLLQMATGNRGVAVTIGDHLALLRDADAPLHRQRRLGANGAVGWAAAPRDAAAPPVKELQHDAMRAADAGKLSLGDVQAPVRREI